MFNIDARVRARISREVQRILIADPNLAASRLLTDLLKDLDAQRLLASSTKRALEIAADWQPQLIFVELLGPELDGIDFTSQLRRSTLPARKAPIIVVTADTRETSIKGARDAGAHEFLCKPFTAGHVFRRVENVMLKPRPWIEAKLYVGPDRRRFNSGQFDGARKRRADRAATNAATLAFTNADVSIRKQLQFIEADPQSALRNIMHQTVELQTAAAGQAEDDLGHAIGSLQKYLVGVMEDGDLKRETVEEHLTAIQSSRSRKRSAAHA